MSNGFFRASPTGMDSQSNFTAFSNFSSKSLFPRFITLLDYIGSLWSLILHPHPITSSETKLPPTLFAYSRELAEQSSHLDTLECEYASCYDPPRPGA